MFIFWGSLWQMAVASEKVLWRVPPTVLYMCFPVSCCCLGCRLHVFASFSSKGCATRFQFCPPIVSYMCLSVVRVLCRAVLKFSGASGAFFQMLFGSIHTRVSVTDCSSLVLLVLVFKVSGWFHQLRYNFHVFYCQTPYSQRKQFTHTPPL